jgi:hypothetical protein
MEVIHWKTQKPRSTFSLRSGKFAKNVKITFDKIGTTAKPFSLEDQGIRMEGILVKEASHRVALNATLSGKMTLDCDRCGGAYSRELDEALKLRISDEVVEDKDNLDIIEFLDGRIDLLYILQGEINALAGDYHFCSPCEANDETLEMEF